MISDINIELDTEISTGYITFSKGLVASTVALTDELNIDLDAQGKVVGLELLQLDAKVPKERLVTEFHLDAQLIEKLSNGFFA